MRSGAPRTKPRRTGPACAKATAGKPAGKATAFTLAEVLAALLFMAIVIPVAMEALHIASRGGAVAEGKAEAANVALRVLNESLITTNWTQSSQSGSIIEASRQFTWTLHNDPWTLDPNQTTMSQLSVEVEYKVYNRPYSVRMTTLINSSLQ